MGNCCSYVLKLDPQVTDPATVSEVNNAIDTQGKGSKSSPKSTKKREKPPKNGGLILALPSVDKPLPQPINGNPESEQTKQDKNAVIIEKTQTLLVEPTPNSYLQGNVSKTVELMPNSNSKNCSLSPEDITRKDARALTSREEEKNAEEKKNKKEKVNAEQLQISEEILKKIDKLNQMSAKLPKEMGAGENSPLRSQTLGNENNLFDDINVNEGTSKTRKEEIKKSLIETKDKIHVLEKKPSKQLPPKEDEKFQKDRSKSIDKKNEPEAMNTENNDNNSVVLPRKSLLKRYKTIGDDGKKEKSKKKVKFKDLFDSKGKKKVSRKKK